ncbi:F0F1 ATP synthase subunit delta [Paenibacillus sp. N1-5-1-14]|uniref:F0F1 ATP synthase subunit delta n=1 Tax=Paenibacillus radicibacter TaxID=2972488 RepID=UPI00215907CD|nr:F0F1 ATP synthase subunit delta [Paenibacillus radicibacter]MCR8645092.1 F0F1 ATP synthase subunit delta [Paenibacillus radicibacter]
MSDIVVAKRYARALFEVAKDKGIIAQVQDELAAVVESFQQNKEFMQILSQPNIDVTKKTALLATVFEGKVSDVLLHTLQLLVTRGREGILNSMLVDYVKIANDALGRADATVYTPFAITAAQEQEIAAQFSKITGKTVHVQSVIKPDLLGGIQVRIGDRLYDGSLSGKLDRLQKSLKSQAL